MNNNPQNNPQNTPQNTPLVRGFRDTFGIANSRTGKLYSDILDYLLVTTHFSDIKLLPSSTYCTSDTEYLIHMDSKLKRALKLSGIVKVICSLQKRTTGNYCIARIYHTGRIKT